ncbi:hypothetical protein L9F63_024612, partial [Diploptera punctata]
KEKYVILIVFLLLNSNMISVFSITQALFCILLLFIFNVILSTLHNVLLIFIERYTRPKKFD